MISRRRAFEYTPEITNFLHFDWQEIKTFAHPPRSAGQHDGTIGRGCF